MLLTLSLAEGRCFEIYYKDGTSSSTFDQDF